MNNKNIEKIESQTFRRLISHLQSRTDVQNIEIMNLAGFCRNCLYKWMHEAASDSNEDFSIEEAQKYVSVCLTRTGKKNFRSNLNKICL